MLDINPYLYSTIYYTFAASLCLMYAFKLCSMSDSSVIYTQNNNKVLMGVIVLILGIWLGMRDVTSPAFADTVLYAMLYDYSTNALITPMGTEFGWELLMKTFKTSGFSANQFFVFVALLYFGFNSISIVRIFKNNTWPVFVIFLISFNTYAFCVNGIRNGLATSIVMLGLSYVITFKVRNVVLGFAIMLVAATIHKTVFLPIACVIAALFVRNFKICLNIWMFSIFLSLLFGNYFAFVFASLGFDDRMTSYLNSGIKYAEMGYKVGFRYDFLIYSAVPIVLGYIAFVSREYKNRVYSLLLNTYVLANSFWVLVIRAAFSNRFAYLSWFLYPIVLAYPLLKLKLWPDQNRKTGLIIMGYVLLNILI